MKRTVTDMTPDTYKQIIIVRKDLNMSPGKMAAQVSHASMAFLTNAIKELTQKELLPGIVKYTAGDPQTGNVTLYQNQYIWNCAKKAINDNKSYFYIKTENGKTSLIPEEKAYGYVCKMTIDEGIYENWINGIFTKTILEAKNKNKLLKAVKLAEDKGMKEGKDFFIIRDNCLTELEPEEVIDGIGRTITCIGFKPMPASVIDKIGKKFQLYST